MLSTALLPSFRPLEMGGNIPSPRRLHISAFEASHSIFFFHIAVGGAQEVYINILSDELEGVGDLHQGGKVNKTRRFIDGAHGVSFW